MLAPQEKYAFAHAENILEAVTSATTGIETNSMVFTPLPSVPVRGPSAPSSSVTESIEPKKMAPVTAVMKGTFGKVIAGEVCAKPRPDGIFGAKATNSTLLVSEPKSSFGISLSRSSLPAPADKRTTVEDIHASFCLPFHQTPATVSPNGIEVSGDDKEPGRTTGQL